MRVFENKIPPPSVAVVIGLAMWGLSLRLPGVDVDEFARVIATSVAALIGVLFFISGAVSFRRAKTTVNPLKPESASSLVTSGIYRISRNPMYVGLALFLVAWAVYLASPWAFLGVVAFVIYINYFQILPEERALAALFGSEFALYQSKVRRWL
jgi:protein-S-isoprenylcysteine O-methyltransferase Ste14